MLTTTALLQHALRRLTAAACVPVRAFSAAGTPRPRASFVCIGDEVLSGKTVDTNSHVLATRLYAAGIDLVRVQTIPDDEAEIAHTLRLENARVGPSGLGFEPSCDLLVIFI